MNDWITCTQPPGLMKMRLMHHQEHHQGHQAPQKQSMMKCATPTVFCCYMNSWFLKFKLPQSWLPARQAEGAWT